MVEGGRKFALCLVAVVLTLAFAAWAPRVTPGVRLRALELVGFEVGAFVVGNVATHKYKAKAAGSTRETSEGKP